jgi:hypothetical protein
MLLIYCKVVLLVGLPERDKMDGLGVFPNRHNSRMVLHTHISPGGWKIGPLVGAVQRRVSLHRHDYRHQTRCRNHVIACTFQQVIKQKSPYHSVIQQYERNCWNTQPIPGQSPFWDADCRPAHQVIYSFLRNFNVHYRIHKSPSICQQKFSLRKWQWVINEKYICCWRN